MRHFEFWPPRLFELPYYLALLALCARHRLSPMSLAKANYALDHGELALGSKYATQMAFDQSLFPATLLLTDGTSGSGDQAKQFAEEHGFPVIMKPEIGSVGKGVMRLADSAELDEAVTNLQSPHLLQAYIDLPAEFGVFYVRKKGQGAVTGINEKHFPEVVGNGTDSVGDLARKHERFSDHWTMFLKDLDTQRIPDSGERVRLSFVGSHTMGCRFTNDTDLASPELLEVLEKFAESQPGFNFGRLDVRARDSAALSRGEFVIIEVNGVASLPTHMFDPQHGLRDGYEIFLAHAKHLVEVAVEQRHQPMELLPLWQLLKKARRNAQDLDRLQRRLLEPSVADSR
ncbi:MAG: hypothetical protein AAF756_04190 [Pseudomonadota bacterium]